MRGTSSFFLIKAVFSTVMQHVIAEVTALVKQAEDAANNKKVCALISFQWFSKKVFLIPQ